MAGAFMALIAASGGGGGGSTPVSYTPAPGSYQVTDNSTLGIGAQFTVSATASVVWTYTISGAASGSVASGGSASSITFSLNQGFNTRTSYVTLSSGGNTWTIALTATGPDPGFGGGGGGGEIP